jgi:SAM-dependent methyltransferase
MNSESLSAATREELREVIARGLAAEYISESSQDSIETGNHYQSVHLDGEVSKGFRSPRLDIMDAIDFRGKTVLDLGSNLGEMSRAARDRGAVMVDGFEYDQYFVDLANTVNAYNRTTRVSFFQRDITDPRIYREPYDIVLAFAVFVYMRPVIDAIAPIVRRGMVLETHRIDDNLESFYMSAIRPHFPAFTKLRDTEWGLPHEGGSVRRAVFAFARDEESLSSMVPGR